MVLQSRQDSEQSRSWRFPFEPARVANLLLAIYCVTGASCGSKAAINSSREQGPPTHKMLPVTRATGFRIGAVDVTKVLAETELIKQEADRLRRVANSQMQSFSGWVYEIVHAQEFVDANVSTLPPAELSEEDKRISDLNCLVNDLAATEEAAIEDNIQKAVGGKVYLAIANVARADRFDLILDSSKTLTRGSTRLSPYNFPTLLYAAPSVDITLKVEAELAIIHDAYASRAANHGNER